MVRDALQFPDGIESPCPAEVVCRVICACEPGEYLCGSFWSVSRNWSRRTAFSLVEPADSVKKSLLGRGIRRARRKNRCLRAENGNSCERIAVTGRKKATPVDGSPFWVGKQPMQSKNRRYGTRHAESCAVIALNAQKTVNEAPEPRVACGKMAMMRCRCHGGTADAGIR